MTSPAIRLPNIRAMRVYRLLLALLNLLFAVAGLLSAGLLAWQADPAAMAAWQPVAAAYSGWIGAAVPLHFTIVGGLMLGLVVTAFNRLHGDELEPAQLEVIRRLAAKGWIVDWNGDTYELYGPTGQRETYSDLADLEYIAEDRT
jgi:hypothetical protein